MGNTSAFGYKASKKENPVGSIPPGERAIITASEHLLSSGLYRRLQIHTGSAYQKEARGLGFAPFTTGRELPAA